jgi:hypothetical protein
MPDMGARLERFGNMMARQQAANRQSELAQQTMDIAQKQEARAVAGENRDIEKFKAEQPARVAGALGAGLVGILHNPSNEMITQVGQTFASVGMEQDKFGPILKQVQDISDPNERKLFVMQFISQSEPARNALKFVMPEVKSEKVGDATVFYDANPASPIMGQELFRFTVAPEPIKMNQQVVDSTLYNVNPVTGVAAEALIGDPTQNLTTPSRQPTFASTGVRSPYAVGAGTGQPSMAAPAAPPAQAVGIPVGGPRGAPGQGNSRTPTASVGTGTPTGAPKTVSEQQRQKGFVKTLELFDYNPETGADSISPLIKASTSGGAEKLGSDIVGFFGVGTPGRVALGQLESLKDSMTFEKLRGKLGAQISDADVGLVASTMGDIANVDTPANVRLEKWQNVVLPVLVRGTGMKYVKPIGGGTDGIPQGAIDKLRKNPSLRGAFDAKYGAGAAARAIGGR